MAAESDRTIASTSSHGSRPSSPTSRCSHWIVSTSASRSETTISSAGAAGGPAPRPPRPPPPPRPTPATPPRPVPAPRSHELPRLRGIRGLAREQLLDLFEPVGVLVPGGSLEELDPLHPRGGQPGAPLPTGHLPQDLTPVDHLAVEKGELGLCVRRRQLVQELERRVNRALARGVPRRIEPHHGHRLAEGGEVAERVAH